MMKKFILRVMPIVLVAVLVLTSNVFAYTVDKNLTNPNGGIKTIENSVNNIWGTVLTVLRILAVAAVVFAGVKYMFASAEGKADIKSGMLGLVIGAIMVFGASIVIEFIMNAAEQV
jgi:type IV secretory pathway VirB2 component (pilin)